MRVLITGATGFVGSHLVQRLQLQHEVFALTRSRSSRDLRSEVQWIEQNLTEPLDYARLPQRLDAILHLAQSKFYREFPERAKDIFELNVHSTFQLLEYARVAGISQFVYASSGDAAESKGNDAEPAKAANRTLFYGTCKYCSELLISSYQQFFNTSVLRLFFPYGERQMPAMLIPRLIRAVHSGEVIALQGSDGIRINPVHIDDVVDAFERSLQLKGNELISVAGPQVLSLREIGNIIGKQLGREPVFAVSQDHEPAHVIGDLTRMNVVLGAPKVAFAEGIAGLCQAVDKAMHSAN